MEKNPIPIIEEMGRVLEKVRNNGPRRYEIKLHFEMNQETLDELNKQIKVLVSDETIDYKYAFGLEILINEKLDFGIINLVATL